MDEVSTTTLVVFSDDWGRHPSSCQHLVRHLRSTHRVLWVNTIGMRPMRPTRHDARRALHRIRDWVRPTAPPTGDPTDNPKVVSPVMVPGFRRRWQRRFNARRMAGAVHGELPSPTPRVAVTTLPIAADLVGAGGLEVDRWVYYCVDDFSVWPGLDGRVMDAMERELVEKVDAVVCVSGVLRERIASMGREADLLTHGVDLEHWRWDARGDAAVCAANARTGAGGDAARRPIALFWGLLDERLDVEWTGALSRSASLVLCGPGEPPPTPATRRPAVAYGDLPALAASADVLVMPYIDAPVTRAMQPLKLLEYLATYKPVVVRDLPATRVWADCCDVVSTADDFVRLCLARAQRGLPAGQRAARQRRLPGESWSEKAKAFEAILHRQPTPSR